VVNDGNLARNVGLMTDGVSVSLPRIGSLPSATARSVLNPLVSSKIERLLVKVGCRRRNPRDAMRPMRPSIIRGVTPTRPFLQRDSSALAEVVDSRQKKRLPVVTAATFAGLLFLVASRSARLAVR